MSDYNHGKEELKIKFVTKCLQSKGIGSQSLANEQFRTVPGFPRGDLKVSKNWIQIRDVYIPKNFIIGTFDCSAYLKTPSIGLNFVLITGESHFKYYIPEANWKYLNNCIILLQRELPHAIIRPDPLLFDWLWTHKKDIQKYFKQQVKEKGIKHLIENHTDFFYRFAMDGRVSSELEVGTRVDIIDKYGTVHTGRIHKIISRGSSKDGCKVMLEERNIVGRVKKVYRKPETIYAKMHPNAKLIQDTELEPDPFNKVFMIVFTIVLITTIIYSALK